MSLADTIDSMEIEMTSTLNCIKYIPKLVNSYIYHAGRSFSIFNLNHVSIEQSDGIR